jgi:hypothetical protein
VTSSASCPDNSTHDCEGKWEGGDWKRECNLYLVRRSDCRRKGEIGLRRRCIFGLWMLVDGEEDISTFIMGRNNHFE